MKHAVSRSTRSASLRRCIPTQSSLLVAFVLSCGLALLLIPAVMAIPPYVALEYLTVGAVCVTAVVVKMLGGRVTDLMKILDQLRMRPAHRFAGRARGAIC